MTNIPAVPATLTTCKPLASRLHMIVTHQNTEDPVAACEHITAGWAPIKSSEKAALIAYGAEVLAALKAA